MSAAAAAALVVAVEPPIVGKATTVSTATTATATMAFNMACGVYGVLRKTR